MATNNQEYENTEIANVAAAVEEVVDVSLEHNNQAERQKQNTHEIQNDQILNNSTLAVVADQALKAKMQLNKDTAPDLWETGDSMGFTEYSLSNSKNQTIIITCNIVGNEDIDHSFSYYPDGWNVENSSKPTDIKMVLDDIKVVYPPTEGDLPTSTTNGVKNWVDFVTGISMATKIDIYSNNNLIATFRPSPKNVKEIASQLAECKPMQYKPPM